MQTEFPIGIIQQDEQLIRANPIAEKLRWESTAPVLALRLPDRGKVLQRLNPVIFSVMSATIFPPMKAKYNPALADDMIDFRLCNS